MLEKIHPNLKPKHYPLLNSVEYIPRGVKPYSLLGDTGFIGIQYLKEFIYFLLVCIGAGTSLLIMDFLFNFIR